MAAGERLKEERKRLKMTQDAFADAGGIAVSTLKLYENGDREAGCGFLSAIAERGADAQYIVTGVRSTTNLAADEQVLLDGFRELDDVTKRRLLAFVLTESGPVAVQKKIKEASAKYAGAKIGAVTEGDVKGTVRIKVGGRK